MKKTLKIILVVLLLFIGLSGCNTGGDAPKPDKKGMTQNELWDLLGKYPRYLSQWGAEDCALVFDNGDELIFDYSVYIDEDHNFYFKELLSFSYEGNDVYKLEYENSYPDNFDTAIFYIDLGSNVKNGFRFGTIRDGKVDYIEVFGDVGLTFKELYAAISKYNTWIEVDADFYGGYFVKAQDNDKFDLGLMNSGFWIQGTVSNLEYHGYMHYTITVDYPGFEGNEMTDPYDPYTLDYYMYYNPYFELLIIELKDGAVEFTPELELSADEFFAELAKYDVWYEVDSDNYRGFFAKFSGQNTFDLGLQQSDFWLQGTVTNVVYHGSMYYVMTVDYPEFEGNELSEPHDAYTAEYHIYYYPNHQILLIGLYDSMVEFSPDVGQGIN